MTELSQKILEKYQVRKNKKQKDAFIAFLQSQLPELKIETYKGSNSKNLILGDPTSAKILVSAHYDTCAGMPIPNFITPLNPLLTIIYGILLIIPALLAVFFVNLHLTAVGSSFWVQYFISVALFLLLTGFTILGPSNPHTVNDNTSGVIALCELYQSLTEENRQMVALIFFDNEEKGLLGSGAYRKQHKNEIKNQLLINLDCISDGDHILLAVSKKARNTHLNELKVSFEETGNIKILLKKAEVVYYPSDQAGFPVSVAVAALKHKKVLGYYMDRIHTKRDTVMEEMNITLIKDSILKLIP